MTDTYSEVGAICPHCQHLHDPADDNFADDNFELYDEDTSEWECHSCDKEFRVSVHKSFSWVTETADDHT